MAAPSSFTHSCFYEGRLWHRRHATLRRQFSYRVMMAYLDLDELERDANEIPQPTHRFSRFTSLRRCDYLSPSTRPLSTAVRDLVQSRLGWRPTGPIRLLTNLRQCGFTMNPLSLFYCFNEDGRELQACVAEVTNTPWNEKHHYVLDFSEQATSNWRTAVHGKELHVSPFFDMQMHYQWRMNQPRDALKVHLQNHRGDEQLFDAVLSLRRREFTQREHWRLLTRYPLQTFGIATAIYTQAARLWLRGVPYVPHPPPANFQTQASLNCNSEPSLTAVSSLSSRP